MASVRISDQGRLRDHVERFSAVDAYEPGPVGKVITVAGALNERTVKPRTEFVVPWQKVYTKAGDMLHDHTSTPTR